MSDKLFSLFQDKSVHRISMIFTMSSQIIATFEKEFAEDKNAIKASIDALIQVLQTHRDAQESKICDKACQPKPQA